MKEVLKKIPFLVSINHGWHSMLRWVRRKKSSFFHCSTILRVRKLALFAPNTAGYYEGLEKTIDHLTVVSAEQVFPLLVQLSAYLEYPDNKVVSAEEFCGRFGAGNEALDLKGIFDSLGCDKSLSHNYHLVYGPVLRDLGKVSLMLEIGLGTTNTDVVSNMGKIWTPGNSLRAFRKFLPEAIIHGADIDKRILFQEERIRTHFVDQTDISTLQGLGQVISGQLDLLIDDGLHAPNANLATLLFALEKVRAGGWIVIEDIAEEALAFWQVVGNLIGARHEYHLIRAHGGLVVAVKKAS